MKSSAPTSDRLVLGTAQLTQQYGVTDTRQISELSDKSADEILATAHALGIKSLDTAPSYGTAEQTIGSTDFDFSVDTKVTSIGHAVPSLLNSVSRLSGKKIRTVFFHEALKFSRDEIEKIVELSTFKGTLFEKIGASIYTVEEFEAAVESGLIDSIQVPYSLIDRRFSAPTLAQATKNGITIHARSLFAQGILPQGVIPNFKGSESLSIFLRNFWAVCKKHDTPYDLAAIQWAARNPGASYLIFGAQSGFQVARMVEALTAPISSDCQAALDDLIPPAWPATDPRQWR